MPISGGGPPPPQQPQATLLVLGIPLPTRSAARDARRVLLVSLVMSLIAVASAILSFIFDEGAGVSLVACLFIPLCGVLGVRRRAPSLLRAFVTTNCVCVGI
jgi:hypothetical protein